MESSSVIIKCNIHYEFEKNGWQKKTKTKTETQGQKSSSGQIMKALKCSKARSMYFNSGKKQKTKNVLNPEII